MDQDVMASLQHMLSAVPDLVQHDQLNEEYEDSGNETEEVNSPQALHGNDEQDIHIPVASTSKLPMAASTAVAAYSLQLPRGAVPTIKHSLPAQAAAEPLKPAKASPKEAKGGKGKAKAETHHDKTVLLSQLHNPPSAAKPNYHWRTIIRATIMEHPNRRAHFTEICDAVSKKFDYYAENDESWKNTVKSNLNDKPCFKRDENTDTEGGYWTVDNTPTAAPKKKKPVKKADLPTTKPQTSQKEQRAAELKLEEQRRIQYEQARTQQAMNASKLIFSPIRPPGAPHPILDAKFALAFDRGVSNLIKNALQTLSGRPAPTRRPSSNPPQPSPQPSTTLLPPELKRKRSSAAETSPPLKSAKVDHVENPPTPKVPDINLAPHPQPPRPRPRPVFIPPEAMPLGQKIHDIVNAPIGRLVPLPQGALEGLMKAKRPQVNGQAPGMRPNGAVPVANARPPVGVKGPTQSKPTG